MTAKHLIFGVVVSALGVVVGEYLKREIFQNEA
jgi:cell division protein FtsL